MKYSNKAVFVLDVVAAILWTICSVMRFMEGEIMMGIIYVAMTCMWAALAVVYWKKSKLDK